MQRRLMGWMALAGLLGTMLLAGCAPGVVTTETGPAAADATPTIGLRPTSAGADVEATPGRDETPSVAVVFTRGGGLTGETQTWTIYTDGKVELSAGAGQGAQSLSGVTAEQVEALLVTMDALKFFELNDGYGANDQCADCFLYSLTVTSNGRTKTVTTHDAATDAPPELGQALQVVQALVAATS